MHNFSFKEDPESKKLLGHEDLEAFANYLGINYEKLQEINLKNAEVVRKNQSSENRFG
jgi:flagellar biosynthesis/type III secretory pathway chaperone